MKKPVVIVEKDSIKTDVETPKSNQPVNKSDQPAK